MIVDAKEVCARHFSFAQKDVPALQGDAKLIAQRPRLFLGHLEMPLLSTGVLVS